MEHYANLTCTDVQIRVEASKAIISGLGDALEGDDVAYCLKRLLRGLNSSRDGARQGFAACLTELFDKYSFNVDLDPA